MENYKEGYEIYRQACENYGLESMTYYLYLKHLTEEQLHAYDAHSKKNYLDAR